MAKTEEELNILKEKVDALSKELGELSEDELQKVAGGFLLKMGKPEKNKGWSETWGDNGYFRH